jgi:bacterioferritin-associated ferredoxin
VAIICHCNAVKERAIVKAIHHGAETVDDVRTRCNAATRCGGCEDAVLDLLDRHAGLHATAPVVGVQVALGFGA